MCGQREIAPRGADRMFLLCTPQEVNRAAGSFLAGVGYGGRARPSAVRCIMRGRTQIGAGGSVPMGATRPVGGKGRCIGPHTMEGAALLRRGMATFCWRCSADAGEWRSGSPLAKRYRAAPGCRPAFRGALLRPQPSCAAVAAGENEEERLAALLLVLFGVRLGRPAVWQPLIDSSTVSGRPDSSRGIRSRRSAPRGRSRQDRPPLSY